MLTPVRRPTLRQTIRTHKRQWTYAMERRWLGDCQASVLRLFCVMLFSQRTKTSTPTRFLHAVTVSLLPPSNQGYGCNHRTSRTEWSRLTACAAGSGDSGCRTAAARGRAHHLGQGAKQCVECVPSGMVTLWKPQRKVTDVVCALPKRTLSAAGRKRIAAAQRAHWAKVKRENKAA